MGWVAGQQRGWFAVGPGLVAAACATRTLRIGSLVSSNNFRHPALLAREAATLDVLSEGRLELEIGAGYYLPEYIQTGIELPQAPDRVEALREALAVVTAAATPTPTDPGRERRQADADVGGPGGGRGRDHRRVRHSRRRRAPPRHRRRLVARCGRRPAAWCDWYCTP